MTQSFSTNSTGISQMSMALPDIVYLDTLPLDDLYQREFSYFREARVRAKVSDMSLDIQLISLKKLYLLKLVKCLMNGANRLQLDELQVHIAKIIGEVEDLGRPDTASKFISLLDICQNALSVASSLVEYSAQVRSVNIKDNAANIPASWLLIAQFLKNSTNDPTWSQLMSAINEDSIGQNSKQFSRAEFSRVISSMTITGWVSSTTIGRNKFLRIGSEALRYFTSRSPISVAPIAAPQVIKWSAFIRDLGCGFAGAFAAFSALATEKHLQLRELSLKSTKQSNKPAVKSELFKLLILCENHSKDACRLGFDLLSRYFKEIACKESANLPRLTVKLAYSSLQPNTDPMDSWVVDFERNHRKSGNAGTKARTKENTGFLKVESSGLAWRNNNLEQLALSDECYLNPRINAEMIEIFKNSSVIKAHGLSDTQWRSCWKDIHDFADVNAAYRSTMIVPITLRNNSNTPEFIELLRHKASKVLSTQSNLSSNISESLQVNATLPYSVDRTIMGYLCFDHPEIGYFDQQDEDVAYVIADWLSLYFFSRHLATTLSESFNNAVQHAGLDNSIVEGLLAFTAKLNPSEKSRSQHSVRNWASPSPPKYGANKAIPIAPWAEEHIGNSCIFNYQ